jgi:hypothetical protein
MKMTSQIAFSTLMALITLTASAPAFAKIEASAGSKTVTVTETDATKLAKALSNALENQGDTSGVLRFDFAECNEGFDFSGPSCYIKKSGVDSMMMSVVKDDADALLEVLSKAKSSYVKANHIDGFVDVPEVQGLTCEGEGEQTKCSITFGFGGGAARGGAA